MVRQGLRIKLRSAIEKASRENIRVMIAGNHIRSGSEERLFNVDVHPIRHEGEALLLICFVDHLSPESPPAATITVNADSHHFTLEKELEATRAELQDAIRDLEVANEDQRAIHEETLSSNEEYQSTNEELLTSKEELQSLNEELTALNVQLRETLDRQRTLSNDLKNVLYSKNVATIFLDPELRIRLFTPSTKNLFNIIPSDIGRPLADLSARFADTSLADEARRVLNSFEQVEHEIKTDLGTWYERLILPYRTQDNEVEGVVITFTDTTQRHITAEALAAAKKLADSASIAKSRFLAAASHDLRQPLQTLSLLQGQLAKTVEGDKAKKMVQRLDEMLGAMSGMLNTLLDINQIEAGTTNKIIGDFPLCGLLQRMEEEFTYGAQSQGLQLRVVNCSLSVRSDPRLLEQMVRNLLSNALKYTQTGKVLLGCRRAPGMVSIEVWDTGIGIPKEEYETIFDEYHQLDNPARDRNRGLGLGLSIVQRVGNLLGHRVRVKSKPGHGSCFAIDVPTAPPIPAVVASPLIASVSTPVRAHVRHGIILIIEDDPEVREMLMQMLSDEGHHMVMASDGVNAVSLVFQGIVRPDLVLADYNLPNGLDGLAAIAKIREFLHAQIAGIILTGDISISTLREIAVRKCVHINKPVKLPDLNLVIQRLLTEAGVAPPPPLPTAPAIMPATRTPAVPNGKTAHIFVVDDDQNVRTAIAEVLEESGMEVETFDTGEAFLAAYKPDKEACLLLDAYLPGISGLALLQKLGSAGGRLQTIMITGDSDVAMAVQAMKAGACDFIEKPVRADELIASIGHALERASDDNKRTAWQDEAANQMANLTARQHEIMDMVLAGHPSKNIAADLDISQRTVENHRAAIMRKTGTKSIPALARLAVAAGWSESRKDLKE